jgi:UDP:flavonoid glycosyltransferase YjiC (YdhE family)
MKILYGVPSEGMGHATRSKSVIQYLIAQQHEVCIVSSDRAFILATG